MWPEMVYSTAEAIWAALELVGRFKKKKWQSGKIVSELKEHFFDKIYDILQENNEISLIICQTQTLWMGFWPQMIFLWYHNSFTLLTQLLVTNSENQNLVRWLLFHNCWEHAIGHDKPNENSIKLCLDWF